MAEPKFVDFKISNDTQLYRLCFDFNNMCDVEQELRVNLMRVMASGTGITASETRAMLYALLKVAHPQVTLVEAGDLVTREMPTVLDAIFKIIFPQAAAEAGTDVKKEEPPTAAPPAPNPTTAAGPEAPSAPQAAQEPPAPPAPAGPALVTAA